jgi:hypothetical protein
MAQATITKRIRLTERVIGKVGGSKKERYENKLAFLKSLRPGTLFFKGPKVLAEGGYQ